MTVGAEGFPDPITRVRHDNGGSMSATQAHPAPDDGPLVFGSCSIDRAGARLKRDGRTLPLTPRAYDVLLYLVQHAGRLVTKNELFDAVWPGVFVGDAALKVCIREIRRRWTTTPRSRNTSRRRIGAAIDSSRRVSADRRASSALARTRRRDAVASETRRGSACGSRNAVRTHYARSGDVNIAYQVVGNWPIDLVFVMGWVSHLDCFWTEPTFAQFLRRLSEFSRV